MGLPSGWVTEPYHDLSPNQQITALGNGVVPLQAALAIQAAPPDGSEATRNGPSR